ncbi:hypothetical protein N7516_010565 [Penicillium verrucosum]|uniref:uncharacterized protein n=1 Tax=Penicillium verrucosum TaxID=60171 RepID=UPI002544D658|nr:uncharacterized protein N7516_010565 [Penicillium verrucosum]KAJ5922862.1 hypothetical protein N7516_010565 [Penicillium verrucosum]
MRMEQKKAIEGAAGGAKGTVEDDSIDLEDNVERAKNTAEDAATAENTTEQPKETAEDAVEDVDQQIPGLETLEGPVCNKLGYIIDKSTGKPLANSPKRGNVIGQAKALPVEEEDDEDCFVEDDNSTRVGRLIEGVAKKLSGRVVDEDGEILGRKGNVIGRAERLEPEKESEEEEVAGYAIGPDGYPIARFVEGNPKELAGKKIEDGEIYDGKKIVGGVELIPEDELDSKPESLFAGIDSLFVTKDGYVEDDEESIIRGRAVDEDGETTDKHGNVKGSAEPYEPPQEGHVEEDLSILERKVVNKPSNMVDPATGAVVGRIVEGDKRLADARSMAMARSGVTMARFLDAPSSLPAPSNTKPKGGDSLAAPFWTLSEPFFAVSFIFPVRP